LAAIAGKIYKFCENRREYVICIIGLGRMDAPGSKTIEEALCGLGHKIRL